MRRKRITAGFILLIVCLAVLICLNLTFGGVWIKPAKIMEILFSGSRALADKDGQIIWNIRLPRLLAAAFLGGGLAVSGLLLQTFFSNPVAGPFVLGISSGAKLVVALVMIEALRHSVQLGSIGLILAAFAGAMMTIGFILLIARSVRNLSFLIICGVMVGYICSAATDIAVTFAEDSNIVNLHNWSLGSFSGITMDNFRTIAIVIVCTFGAAMMLSKPMEAYQLGEVYASSMGVRVRTFRLALILLSGLLAACVTAFAGPVSFVGIAVPHLIKNLFGTSKPLVVLPACFLGGAAFCLICDLIARTAFSPTELGIGTVTAVFGAPVVIWMLLRRNRERE